MKVLWITNIVFPEAQRLLNGNSHFAASGGWMLGAANALIACPDIQLSVATPTKDVSTITELRGEHIRYFLFPLGKGNLKKNDEYRKYWREIHDLVIPDIVHIHGTEFSHGLAYIDECGADNVFVSIQGLTSEISKYYSLGLSSCEIIQNLTLGDLVRGSVLRDVKKYRTRGEVEIELIKKVHHVIGRTRFDKSHVWSINPQVEYYFCNETLRDVFYVDRWQYEHCQPYSIFFSQANNPLKGLHFMLDALKIIKEFYPDAKLHIAGRDITTHSHTLRGLYAYSGYGKLILRKIKKYHLQENVCFTGPLTANQIKNELLKANVFVCASTIENSSNSLAEAQILGVPCVASFVGGIPDMIPNDACGTLYRCEDITALAYSICKVFQESHLFDNTEMIANAQNRHNPQDNAEQLMKIYGHYFSHV